MQSHENWFGSLFPAKTSKDKSLAAYAQHFNSIEGNTSLHHIPDEKTVRRWNEQVPSDFRFTFRFHRSISHDKKLVNVNDDLTRILRSANEQGPAVSNSILKIRRNQVASSAIS